MQSNPLAAKLEAFTALSEEEGTQIASWCAEPRAMAARQVLKTEGAATGDTCIMLQGWARRFKSLADGRRQIVGLMLPGDMCDLHELLLRTADHSVGFIGTATVALVQSDKLRQGFEQFPRLKDAFWWSSLVDKSISREWLLNLGSREAAERLAHLLCELWARLDRVGLASGNSFEMPMIQEDLGETLGITSVHTNRTLQKLRRLDLVISQPKRVTLDLEGLRRFAGFDPNYLHLPKPA